MYESARSLRTTERYLIAPPFPAMFGSTPVLLSDISKQGARFRHDNRLETGSKAVLKVAIENHPKPLALEAMIVWSQADVSGERAFVSGVRMYGSPDVVDGFLAYLRDSKRSNRIEELRATDRFFIHPPVDGFFGHVAVHIDDLSARGSRIGSEEHVATGTTERLSFRVPGSDLDVSVTGRIVWSQLKSLSGDASRYHAGMAIDEKPEVLRLAIGQLSHINRAALDTKSLALKLKIMRARARQLAPSFRDIEAAGIPAEQYLLIQGVREELRLNPEEAFHWYQRARIIIRDSATRAVAPVIADHPDALAVWEYLDRSVDPSIVGRAFDLKSNE